MMIDRMFLAEEQQSFLKLQSDLKLQQDLEEGPPPGSNDRDADDDDSAADIKPDFQLPADLIDDFVSVKQESESEASYAGPTTCYTGPTKCYAGPTNTDFNIKCGLNYFADESCDSVYESRDNDDEFLEEAEEEKTKTSAGSGGNGGESYNTTKIIGNFEIEINNKGCNAQESYTKNFRQKIIENKSDGRKNSEEGFEKSDDYDEWLCIQRELGYLSDSKTDSPGDSSANAPDKNAPKRNSNENRLESLKKFRVEKHSNKSKKTGSIIGEVKFEVRIEHKKVFAEQSAGQKSTSAGQKRAAHFDFTKEEGSAGQAPLKRQKNEVHIKQEEGFLEELPELLDATSSDELIDTSIDEQVQSAIDSILNLQQIASMTEKDAAQHQQIVTCRNINTLTHAGGAGTSVCGASAGPPDPAVFFNEAGDTLDDAVKSILS